MTEDGSVFVDHVVQCWEKWFNGRGSGVSDKQVKAIGWLIGVKKKKLDLRVEVEDQELQRDYCEQKEMV